MAFKNIIMTSKRILIALVLIAAILVIAFFISLQREKRPLLRNVENNFSGSIESYKGNPTSPNQPESQFAPIQYEITGYYTSHDVIRYPLDYDAARDPKPGTVTCSALLITDGDNEIVSKYKEIAKNGNTVNRLDSKGNLMLNIDLRRISQVDRDTILKSTSDSQVSIMVADIGGSGKDADYCSSFVNILSAK